MSATAAERWAKARSFHHSSYSAQRIAAEREQRVTVCLPARECAETIGEIVGGLLELRAAGVLDEVLVVDADSADGTAAVAAGAGAVVRQEAELMPALGPVLGKGDAMWRALQETGGEIVCFLDGDTGDPSPRHLIGLLGPILSNPDLQLV